MWDGERFITDAQFHDLAQGARAWLKDFLIGFRGYDYRGFDYNSLSDHDLIGLYDMVIADINGGNYAWLEHVPIPTQGPPANAATTSKIVNKTAEQVHHFATNKSKQWTQKMANVVKKYGLKLDEDWNKMPLAGHSGRHTNWYHRWVLERMKQAAREAGKDKDKFLELFDKYVIKPVLRDPTLPYKKK